MKNRRFLFFSLFPILLTAQTPLWEAASLITPLQENAATYVERWAVLEITLTGPKGDNPFRDVQLSALFVIGNDSTTVNGFYDGNGVYKIRFMPQQVGAYSFVTRSSAQALDGRSGSFICYPAAPGNHGPVRVTGAGTFAYADGTPFIPVGTTAFAWIHQPAEKQQETLASLAAAPFNRLRMTLFPMNYLYTTNEPTLYPFPRSRKGENDLNRFDSRFFRILERRLTNLANLGIEADIILFHPWDRWGYAAMDKAADDFYLRYVTARLAAFRNVWWTVAAEYDQMEQKDEEDWDHYFEILYENDPYDHPRTIHHRRTPYDVSKPWISHCSWQGTPLEELPQLLERVQKPILLDEQAYEGNLIPEWGRFSASEIVRRFWTAALSGAFYTHGETIKNPQHEWIWWNKGGTLLGESPARIGFLRRIIEEAPGRLRRVSPECGAVGKECFLYYYPRPRPGRRVFELPPMREYRVELIDAWNMTVEPLGRFSGRCEIEMPDKPHTAVRMRRVGLVFPFEPVEILYNGNLFLQQAVVELRHPRSNDIRFTLDGSLPTPESPRYQSPIVIQKDSTLLRVAAFSEDGRSSRLSERLFRKAVPLAAEPLQRVKRGVRWTFYIGEWDKLPDFNDLRPQRSGVGDDITTTVAAQLDAYALVFEGYIKVPTSDIYTFSLLSDDGGRLFIGGKLVTDNDGRHAERRRSGQIGLAAGYHPFRLEYFEAGGDEKLEVYWANSTGREERLTGRSLFIEK